MARTANGLPGIYNTSPFTLLTGEGSALSIDANGNQYVVLASAISGIISGAENDTILTAPHRRTDSWQNAQTDTDITTPTVVQAGVAAKKIYITDIVISAPAAMIILLQDEDDVLHMPLTFPAAGIFSKQLATPIQLGTDKDLEIKSDTVGVVKWLLTGYQI